MASPADKAAVMKLRKVKRQIVLNLKQDSYSCIGGSAGNGQGVDPDGDPETETRSFHDSRVSIEHSSLTCSCVFCCIIPLKLPIVAELSSASSRVRLGAFGDK